MDISVPHGGPHSWSQAHVALARTRLDALLASPVRYEQWAVGILYLAASLGLWERSLFGLRKGKTTRFCQYGIWIHEDG